MLLSVLIVALTFVLHQDWWFWQSARPFVFGFLPVGLFYHAAYTLALSLVFSWLVRRHWPSALDAERE